MTGGTLLGLTLLSMGWLFFLAGTAVNFTAWWRLRKAPAGARFGGLLLLPGLIGSITVFFSVGSLLASKWHVPWPWLWILLPLFLDVGCLGRFVLAALRLAGRRRG